MSSSEPVQPVINVKLKIQHLTLGGIFVAAGCCLFVGNVITLIFSDGFVNHKTGIWMGIFAIGAGLLAIFAARKDNKHLLIASLVMDIACAILSNLALSLISDELAIRSENQVYKLMERFGKNSIVEEQVFQQMNNGTDTPFSFVGMKVTMAYDRVALLGMLATFIAFIVHGSMCCFDLCECCAICCSGCVCCCPQQRRPVVRRQLITNQPAQVITMQTGVPGSGITMQTMPGQYNMPGQYMPGQVMPGQYNMPGQVMPGQVNNPYPNYQYSQVPPTGSQYPTGSYPVQQPTYNPNYTMNPIPTDQDVLPSKQAEEAHPPPSYDDASK